MAKLERDIAAVTLDIFTRVDEIKRQVKESTSPFSKSNASGFEKDPHALEFAGLDRKLQLSADMVPERSNSSLGELRISKRALRAVASPSTVQDGTLALQVNDSKATTSKVPL